MDAIQSWQFQFASLTNISLRNLETIGTTYKHIVTQVRAHTSAVFFGGLKQLIYIKSKSTHTHTHTHKGCQLFPRTDFTDNFTLQKYRVTHSRSCPFTHMHTHTQIIFLDPFRDSNCDTPVDMAAAPTARHHHKYLNTYCIS